MFVVNTGEVNMTENFNFSKEAGDFMCSEYRQGTILREIQMKLYSLGLVKGTLDTSVISRYCTSHGCAPRHKRRIGVGEVRKTTKQNNTDKLVTLVEDIMTSNLNETTKAKLFREIAKAS